MQGNCLYLGNHHLIPLKRWGGIENPLFHLFHLSSLISSSWPHVTSREFSGKGYKGWLVIRAITIKPRSRASHSSWTVKRDASHGAGYFLKASEPTVTAPNIICRTPPSVVRHGRGTNHRSYFWWEGRGPQGFEEVTRGCGLVTELALSLLDRIPELGVSRAWPVVPSEAAGERPPLPKHPFCGCLRGTATCGECLFLIFQRLLFQGKESTLH